MPSKASLPAGLGSSGASLKVPSPQRAGLCADPPERQGACGVPILLTCMKQQQACSSTSVHVDGVSM